jgi:DNA polymerase
MDAGELATQTLETQMLHIDFETRSACDLKKSGVHVYARHPSTEVLCLSFAIDDGPEEILTDFKPEFMWELFDAIQSGADVFAHNAAFEHTIWNEVGVKKYGWDPLPLEQIHCTMAMCYALSLPGSLDDASAAVGLDHRKDMQGHRVMMQLSKPKKIHADGRIEWVEDAEKFKKLLSYCKNDVVVERELHRRLLKLSQSEREMWILDQKINGRGIKVDLDSARKAIAMVELEQERLDEEMKRVTENKVGGCTKVSQLTEWILDQGFSIDGVAKADIVELLKTPELPENVKQALLLRQEAAKSSTRKLQAMINSACGDSRIRGTLQYHVASTGRWGGRLVQPHNMPRPSVPQSVIDEIFAILGRTESCISST